MTEDASPENLRKFLESDDPAMVRMGLSMAKGTGVKVTVKDLEHFLKNEDIETIKTGVMLADEADIGDEAMEMLCEALGDEDDDVRQDAAYALGMIGDARAVEALMSNLGVDAVGAPDEHYWVIGEVIIAALGSIGDARAIQPLIELLDTDCERLTECVIGGQVPSDDGYYYRDGSTGFVCQVIVDSIIQIGSRKAIEPLLATLNHAIEVSQDWWLPELAAETLTGLGWKPETDEQQASYLIATKDWEGCKETGEPLVTKAVLYLAHPIYGYAKTGERERIMRAVDSFGETMIRIFKDNPANEGVAEALEVLGHEV
jgi:HEAT repeat protein